MNLLCTEYIRELIGKTKMLGVHGVIKSPTPIGANHTLGFSPTYNFLRNMTIKRQELAVFQAMKQGVSFFGKLLGAASKCQRVQVGRYGKH